MERSLRPLASTAFLSSTFALDTRHGSQIRHAGGSRRARPVRVPGSSNPRFPHRWCRMGRLVLLPPLPALAGCHPGPGSLRALDLGRASIGQAIVGLRVEARPGRSFPSLPVLYVRHITKFLLGGLSLAFVPFAPRGEAIHDRLFGVVLVRGDVPQPVEPIRPEKGSARRMLAMGAWLIFGSIIGSIGLSILVVFFIPEYVDAGPVRCASSMHGSPCSSGSSRHGSSIGVSPEGCRGSGSRERLERDEGWERALDTREEWRSSAFYYRLDV